MSDILPLCCGGGGVFLSADVDISGDMGYNIYIGYSIYLRGDEMQKFEVLFYSKADGTEPAMDFIMSLDKKMRTKVLRLIEMLEYGGYELREPYSKHIEDGIFELRAKVGSDISRVMYFFVIGSKAILTNGFIKKTQKTPRSEIEKAKTFRNDFLKREENEYDKV